MKKRICVDCERNNWQVPFQHLSRRSIKNICIECVERRQDKTYFWLKASRRASYAQLMADVVDRRFRTGSKS